MSRRRKKKPYFSTVPTVQASHPSAEKVAELKGIFIKKNWSMDGEDGDDFAVAFDKVCKISAELDERQYDLFKILLEQYVVIPYESYKLSMRRTMKGFPVPANLNKIYHVAPVIAPEDIGENKSGIQMVYPFLHDVWKKSDALRKNKIFDHISPRQIKESTKDGDVYTSIFLDDFIGTGNTVGKFLDDYEQNYKRPGESIVFVAICIMERGLKYIRSRGYDVYYDRVIKKGIEDCEDVQNKADAETTMRAIEAGLKVFKGYELGYDNSQALVTMIRTPNNTFPMFWLTQRNNSGEWPAPFPR